MKFIRQKLINKLTLKLDELDVPCSAQVDVIDDKTGKSYIGFRSSALNDFQKELIKKNIPKVTFFKSSKIDLNGKPCVVVAYPKPLLVKLFEKSNPEYQ